MAGFGGKQAPPFQKKGAKKMKGSKDQGKQTPATKALRRGGSSPFGRGAR